MALAVTTTGSNVSAAGSMPVSISRSMPLTGILSTPFLIDLAVETNSFLPGVPYEHMLRDEAFGAARCS